ncbi:MAG: pyocin knob domain-containing protein [Muribaculaceae bacterium]|nr:pyocin knob domain-containing protein [Muribaculaceae bacterium]
MATIRQRINRKNAAGTYDTIHLETSSDVVLRPDGTTLESTIVQVLEDLANKSGVTYSTTKPKAAGTASPGTAATVARSDHIHPAQTEITGNAATATAPNMQSVAASTNLNNLITPGWYTCPANATAKTLTNCPTANAFVLQVLTHAGVYQRIVEYLANGAAKVYWRNLYNGTWSAWQREYTTIDKPTAVDVGAVPTTRKVNGKALSTDITLAAADVGAAASSHTHAAQTSVTGNAGTATKLETARTFLVNLASTTAVSFDGSANVTPGVTGILSAANGGTGVNSLASLKTSLGIGSPTITAPTYPASIPAVGSTMTWAGKTWRVVHKLTGIAILALEYWEKNVAWSASATYSPEFTGSNIWMECMNFANTLKLFAADYILPFSGLPCFIASYDQIFGSSPFTYFATQANRIFKNNAGTVYMWWVCSNYGSSSGVNLAYTVSDTGIKGNRDATNSLGFRPFVAIRL